MLWLLLACTSDDSDTLITPVETGDTYIEWPDDTGALVFGWRLSG